MSDPLSIEVGARRLGCRGVGESALLATAPVILGAIRHATGVTVRHVPALPHRLWALIHNKEKPA